MAEAGGSVRLLGMWLTCAVLLIAKDGRHYAANVKMVGPGKYALTYRFRPPATNGFLRHIDKETGVPPWWKPFGEKFAFNYPQNS